MFWKKDEEVVSCETCKCLLKKKHASVVEVGSDTPHFYCKTHKKPFSKIIVDFWGMKPYRHYAELEVTEDGTPVGYVRETKNSLENNTMTGTLSIGNLIVDNMVDSIPQAPIRKKAKKK